MSNPDTRPDGPPKEATEDQDGVPRENPSGQSEPDTASGGAPEEPDK